MSPISRQIRAYFAPVDRATQTPVLFDPAQQAAFDLDAPPSPWLDLGPIRNFTRKSASQSAPILTGMPAAPQQQVRASLQAELTLQFLSWTKLPMALATGSQHMNVLAPATGASPSGASPTATGSAAAPAIPLQPGSTATFLALNPADTALFTPGQLVALDADYTGQTGFVGSPIAAAYLRAPLAEIDYLRRITFNVGVISSVSSAGLTLSTALPSGPPIPGAKLQAVTAFVDREGGSFYPEWSALFVAEGAQGDRLYFHYPRLQPAASAQESAAPLAGATHSALHRTALEAHFLALPVLDPLDGERILCYRTYVPAGLPAVRSS